MPTHSGKPAELTLLEQIRARAAQSSRGAGHRGLYLGIGDDCALLRIAPGEDLAVTTDLAIDGRHFRLPWHSPESIGHRTLARGLSDLAAMGARPVAAFLSLGLPKELVSNLPGSSSRTGEKTWLTRFLDGFLALAREFRTPLAGGDLAESPIALADVILTGAVPRGKALLRSGARPGDLLYVTGCLGGAASALARLAHWAESNHRKHASNPAPPRIPSRLQSQLALHLFPQPRVAQGLWLVRHALATAAIDLSDGLSTDLTHLCDESRVAAEVDAASLPIHSGATLAQALHGGEDYELLFTAPPAARIPRRIAGVPITPIGRILHRRKGRPAIALVNTAEKAIDAQPLEPMGWQHFS
jgi:thiamine-monophosphate kinase